MVPPDRVLLYTKSIVAAVPGIAAGLGISLLVLSLLTMPISEFQQGHTLLNGVVTPETVGRALGRLTPAALFFFQCSCGRRWIGKHGDDCAGCSRTYGDETSGVHGTDRLID